MQVVDKDGNVYGQGLQITSIDGKPKTIFTPGGIAGGDLSGSYPNPSVIKLLGNTIPINANGYLKNDGSGGLTWATVSTGITVNTTPITGGTSGRLLFDDAGVVGETDGVFWDKVNQCFAIGTTIAGSKLTVSSPVAIKPFSATTVGDSNWYPIASFNNAPTSNTAFGLDIQAYSNGSNRIIKIIGNNTTNIYLPDGISATNWNLYSCYYNSYWQDAILYLRNTTGGLGAFRFTSVVTGTLMSILENGSVLIGTTTSAGYKLDVAGSIRTQSSLVIANPAFTLGGSITHSANATLSIVGGPASESIVIGPSNRIFINAGQVRFPNGSVQMASTLTIGSTGATSTNMLLMQGSITAGSSIARGIGLETTLVQSAANDVLTAVNIAPTFTVNNTLFHDVYWARITGSYAPAAFSANNNATTIDLNNSFTNTNNAIGIRIRHTYSNVQNGYGILLESASFIGIAQTSTTSFNYLAGTTVIGATVGANVNPSTLNVINGANGAIKVGNLNSNSEHLVISHSQAGNTFSSIRNTYASTGASMLIDVAAQGNLRLFGTGNVGVKTTVDGGFTFDVNGTMRVQGNFTMPSGTSLTVGSIQLFDDTAGVRIIQALSNQGLSIRAGSNTVTLNNSASGGNTSFSTTGSYFIQPNGMTGSGGINIFGSSSAPSSTTISFKKIRNDGAKSGIINTEDFATSGITPINLFIYAGKETILNNQANLILCHDGTTARGNTLIGTTTNVASAIVNVESTTQGFLPPRMSNVQMLAIATPSEGLVVYDLTNRKLCCYDGVTWQPLF